MLHRLPRRACSAEVLEERRSHHLPLVVNPFLGLTDGEPEERAPTWLDLFFDLAIAAALQVYAINAASGLAQYVVATAVVTWLLMWSTWSTTVAYDTRFRTDDVVNVIFKFCQISILLLIAGYTNYFDVAALGERPIAPVEDGSSDDDVYFSVFTGQAWSGMALAFAIGKYLAALQRGYVLVWARIIGRKITPALVLPMLAPFITAIAWTAVRELRGSTWSGADKLRYCVAFLSLGIEIGVSILTARLRSGNVDTIVNLAGERFRLLTLLVLGEGLLGIAKVLSNAVGSLGYSASALGQAALTILTVVLTFYLLFPRTTPRLDMGRVRTTCWTLLNFPLHAMILLFLEACSAALLNANLENALGRLFDTLSTLDLTFSGVSGVPETAGFLMANWTETDQHISLDLLKIGVSWSSERDKLARLYRAVRANGSDASTQGDAYSAFYSYGVQLDRNSVGLAHSLQHFNATMFINDDNATLAFSSQLDAFAASAYEPTLTMLPAAGGILFMTLVLSVLQRRPSNAWAWFTMLPRAAVALSLCLCGLLVIGNAHTTSLLGLDDESDSSMPAIYTLDDQQVLLPIIAAVFGGLAVVEWGISHLGQRGALPNSSDDHPQAVPPLDEKSDRSDQMADLPHIAQLLAEKPASPLQQPTGRPKLRLVMSLEPNAPPLPTPLSPVARSSHV